MINIAGLDCSAGGVVAVLAALLSLAVEVGHFQPGEFQVWSANYNSNLLSIFHYVHNFSIHLSRPNRSRKIKNESVFGIGTK